MSWDAVAVTVEYPRLRPVEKFAAVGAPFGRIFGDRRHQCPRFETREAWGSLGDSACGSKHGPAPHLGIPPLHRTQGWATRRKLQSGTVAALAAARGETDRGSVECLATLVAGSNWL